MMVNIIVEASKYKNMILNGGLEGFGHDL